MKNKITILLPAIFVCSLFGIMGLYFTIKIIGATIYAKPISPSPTPKLGLGKYVEVPWLYTTAHQEPVVCPLAVPPDDVVDLVSITFGNETNYFEGIDIFSNGEIFPTTPSFGAGWTSEKKILESFGDFHLADGYQQVIEDPENWWLKISRCGEKLYYQKWQYNPNEGNL